MALIKCPDCGKEFSDAAAACPNCGRPNKCVAAAVPATPKKKTSPLALGCLGIIAIGVVSSIVSQQSRSPADVAASAQHSQDFELEYTAKEQVKAQLRDPSSADFRNVAVVHHQNGAAVCGEVNAKNGFGGFTGFTEFIVVQTAVMRTDANGARFVKIWNKTCR